MFLEIKILEFVETKISFGTHFFLIVPFSCFSFFLCTFLAHFWTIKSTTCI